MHNRPHEAPNTTPPGVLLPAEPEIEVDVDNDPGNEDPGSQFDRDATVPLIDADE